MKILVQDRGSGSPWVDATSVIGGFSGTYADLAGKPDLGVILVGDLTGTGTGTVTGALANVVTAGTAGGTNTVPVITWDAKGRVTAVGTATVAPSAAVITLTGDVTGTGTSTVAAVIKGTATLVAPNIGAASGASLSLSGAVSLASTGAAATSGSLTLVGGTKTINTTAATATCLIFFQRVTAGGTIGFATTYTKVNNTSFTLNSDSALDTSVYNWWIVETH